MAWAAAFGVVLAVVLAEPGDLAGQTIRGRLLEDGSERPIVSGLVSLLREAGGTVASVLTDANGRFLLLAPGAGDYVLSGQSLGYRTGSNPIRLIAGDTVDVDFILSVNAVLLAPITVTASARSWAERYAPAALMPFYDRRNHYGKLGLGRFFTREQFADMEAMPVSQYLMGSVAGLRAVSTGGTTTITMRAGAGRGDCQPQFYMNGTRFPLMGENIDALFRLSELEGIEVYRGAAEVPGEFAGSDAACGVIVFWFRRGTE